MHRYIIKRLLMLIPVLLGVAFIIFAIMSVAEGDPVYQVAGPDATEEQLEALREEMGLNGSLIERYFRYIGNLLKGDLGVSYVTKLDVMQLYLQRLPNTLRLASIAMLVAVALSVPLGIVAAVNQNSWKDTLAMILALLGLSMPNFWLGLLLMLLFSLKLGWLPSGGAEGFTSVILPAVTVGVGLAALLTRTTRSSMLDVINQDYTRTARAYGVSKTKIILAYAFKNAFIPVLTAIGLRFGSLLAGATMVETIFNIPGIGTFLVNSVNGRDYPAIQSTVLVLSCSFVIVNTFVDILYGFVDPRVKIK